MCLAASPTTQSNCSLNRLGLWRARIFCQEDEVAAVLLGLFILFIVILQIELLSTKTIVEDLEKSDAVPHLIITRLPGSTPAAVGEEMNYHIYCCLAPQGSVSERSLLLYRARDPYGGRITCLCRIEREQKSVSLLSVSLFCWLCPKYWINK